MLCSPDSPPGHLWLTNLIRMQRRIVICHHAHTTDDHEFNFTNFVPCGKDFSLAFMSYVLSFKFMTTWQFVIDFNVIKVAR